MTGFSTPGGQCLLCSMHQFLTKHDRISPLKGTKFQNETNNQDVKDEVYFTCRISESAKQTGSVGTTKINS
jgi:hypothetical protein